MGKAEASLEILTEADSWGLQRLTLSVSLFSITISSVSAPASSSRKGLVEGGGTSGFFCRKRGISLGEQPLLCPLAHSCIHILLSWALQSTAQQFAFSQQRWSDPGSLSHPSTLSPSLFAPTLPESSLKEPLWHFHSPKPHSKVCGLHWDNPQQQLQNSALQ